VTGFHRVDTALPRDVSATAPGTDKARLFNAVVAYDLQVEILVERAVTQQAAIAVIDAGLGKLPGAGFHRALPAHEEVALARESLVPPEQFLPFLDAAFLREPMSAQHMPHESHHPAAACDCWDHRRSFYSLFNFIPATSLAELTVALAAMKGRAQVKGRANAHVQEQAVLLVLYERRFVRQVFAQHYFGEANPGLLAALPPMILIRATLSIKDVDAARAAPGRRSAAAVGEPFNGLCDSEFWTAIDEGTLLESIRQMGTQE
jgi:hypothetical protein